MANDYGVQSIERALDIIEAVAANKNSAVLTKIAEKTGLHKSTAYRIIATLFKRGYLKKNEDGTYKIGLKLIEAVSYYIDSLELQTEVRPYIAQITAKFGLTSHLGILEGDKVVYIEKMDIFSNIKLYSQIGLRMHAYCSSLGKCLLANYSNTQLRSIMGRTEFTRFTPNTITTIEALQKEIDSVRQRGWAIDNEEFEIGHRCIGAPVYDYRGDIIAAISASGSTTILTDERIPEIVEYLKQTAAEISQNMGYVP